MVNEVGKSEVAPLQTKVIVEKVMGLESSWGKNNYSKCEAQGLYNRYGYGIPGDGSYLCFEKDDDTKVVEDWFNRHLEKYTLAQSLCRFNTGKATDDCPYYQKFLKIKK